VKTEAEFAEYLILLHIPGNQVSCFLPEMDNIFPSVPFVSDIPVEAFLVGLDVPGQI